MEVFHSRGFVDIRRTSGRRSTRLEGLEDVHGTPRNGVRAISLRRSDDQVSARGKVVILVEALSYYILCTIFPWMPLSVRIAGSAVIWSAELAYIVISNSMNN
jgi:hypothetical protein